MQFERVLLEASSARRALALKKI